MRIAMLGFGAMLCAAATSPVRADDAAARKAIEVQYAKMASAMKHKDMAMLKSTATADFTMKMPGQPTVNMQQAEAMMKQQFAMMPSIEEVSVHIDKLTVKGSTAIALASEKMRATTKGPDGKTHQFADSSTARDTWVKTPRGWRCKFDDNLTEHSTLDGKPVGMAAPHGGSH